MDSDDNIHREGGILPMSIPGYPPFSQFGQKEEDAYQTFYSMLKKAASHPSTSRVTTCINFIKSYRVEAFFETVQGFYTGSLDPGGRHLTRYSKVQELWKKYISSFLDLSDCISGTQIEDKVWWDGKTKKYSFEDRDDWTRFCDLWKIPPTINYDRLLCYTRKTLDILSAASGIPKIQKVCLLDLPEELLDAIFSYCSLEKARRLSSTCRLLNKIGIIHVTSARDIIIRRSAPSYEEVHEAGHPLNPNFRTTALAARDLALASCHDLEECHDDCDRLKTLRAINQWFPFSALEIPIFLFNPVGTFDNRQFYEPIYKSLEGVLGSSLNLTTFGFSRMKLTLELLLCLCRLPRLDVLEFHHSTISKKALKALNRDNDGSLITSVRRLDLIMTDAASSWYTMLFCPKLSSFSATHEDALPPPPSKLWGRPRFFPTLKYLYLGSLTDPYLEIFEEWIRSLEGVPMLTHLRVTTVLGISATAIALFLQGFQGAPLKFLSIEGALQVHPLFVHSIAQQFSHLLDLIIYCHDSTRQRRNVRTDWPFPAWEYAKQFSEFSQLQRFCWNNRRMNGSYSTSPLLDLEDGWKGNLCSDLMSSSDPSMDSFDPDIDIFDNLGDILMDTVLFGVHCPTLRMLSILREPSCVIVRTPAGDGVVKNKIRLTHNFSARLDPDDSWPC